MSNLTSILSSDLISTAPSVLTGNFQNLNQDKTESANYAQTLAGASSTLAISPAGLNALYRFAYKSSTQGITTSVLANDDHLSIPVGVNEVWGYNMNLFYKSATAPDIKITMVGPAGTTGGWGDAATFSTDVMTYGSVMGIATANVDEVTLFTGTAIVGSVAGNVRLQWAQNVDTVSSITTVLTGSNIIAHRLA